MNDTDLRHTIISLLVGVATIAITSIVQGLLHIFLQWVTAFAGGTAASVSYLNLKHLV